MLFRDALALFLALGLSYVIFMMAKKEKQALQTLGYTLATAIFLLSIIHAASASYKSACAMQRMGEGKIVKIKPHSMMMKHYRK